MICQNCGYDGIKEGMSACPYCGASVIAKQAVSSADGGPSCYWYLSQDGQQIGLMMEEQFIEKIKNVRVRKEAYVWNSQMGDTWQPIMATPMKEYFVSRSFMPAEEAAQRPGKRTKASAPHNVT